MTKNYHIHTLKVGSPEERIETIGLIKTRFVLKDRILRME